MVARWAHNPKVAGSSPVPATRKTLKATLRFFYGIVFLDRVRTRSPSWAEQIEVEGSPVPATPMRVLAVELLFSLFWLKKHAKLAPFLQL